MAPLTDKGVIKRARFSIETCDGSPVAYVISSPIIVGYHKRLWSHRVTEREKYMKVCENRVKIQSYLYLLQAKQCHNN